ncbi:hypothetical protein SteCoe_2295 [Stentor coeruleus]|uniref:Uncharacterized protein n=1 Tax=Stentor coeruleus TaxID=5963 RepID=A0A1R2CZT2_9CILI|nr:hypothetical protein SteCoe_2295 [Stentor coeruleus]
MKYKKAPAWSIPSGRSASKPALCPGPGAYSPSSSVSPNSPSFTIGRSKRYEATCSGVIGPSSYTPIKKFSVKSAIFGSSPKNGLEISNTTPGPGQYEMNTSLDGPQFSICGRDKHDYRSSTPGPGQYNIPRTHGVPSYIFSREKRIARMNNKSPGPGTYEIPRSCSSKGVIFDRQAKKSNNITEVPGPGAYETSIKPEAAAYTIVGKNLPKSRDNSPGPADYDLQPTQTSGSFSIGKSKRFSDKPFTIPGPGAYENGFKVKIKTTVFGKSKRPLIQPSNPENPGPGRYNLPNKSVEGPAYSIRIRTNKHKSNEIPGPGAYNVDLVC